MARFTKGGRLDSTFGRHGVARIEFDGGDDTVRGLAELPDGPIVAAGFSPAGGGSENFAGPARSDRPARPLARAGRPPDDRLFLGGRQAGGVTVLPGPVLLLFGHAERGNQRDTAFYWLRP